ncbi:hypothetical protein ACE198_16325 [Neobacillus sp. KR4-4]|uniref:hypothetical protein n=1 Tax=Neobacillus sp. KR4-4 TaxID=3344872 RepID=UPI0035CA0CE9
MDKTTQENRKNVYWEGSDGQIGQREQAKCLSGGVRWTKRPREQAKYLSEGGPMDKTGQENRKNVYREGSDGQNHTREQAKCLSEGFYGQNHTREQAKCLSGGIRWTKPHKRTGKMSIGRIPIDKTGQENRQNVYREGSDGQNHTREQAKGLSEGFRWTKRPKRTGKMSIAKGPMDKPT